MLSRIRERGGLWRPTIAERRATLRCGIAMVNLETGQMIASLLFRSGIEEIFDVQVLPGYRGPVLSGPYPDVDQTRTLWLMSPMLAR